ncbi:glycoside hydrolase family 36 protein [Lacticaseibacillus hegangensis]|uniref:Glycoside hydrolase family 36 protein n=1 Tax=Lacticaseibacillus hegangensis TaxID=2486010 RepID=A0ABW4CW03_9LACO|nr:glycoside hydrolase family 36 protein [Lacticaseibacillus hegangensis]
MAKIITLSTLKKYQLGDMVVHYLQDTEGHVEWTIYPAELASSFRLPTDQVRTNSLVQAKLREDYYDKNFTNGTTMLNCQTSQLLKYQDQRVEVEGPVTTITTTLADTRDHRAVHFVQWDEGENRLKTWVKFTNLSAQTALLDWLPSFVLSDLTPFYDQQPQGKINLVRLRSKWTMEGRIEEQPVELYNLEPSWSPSGLGIEQFGQAGTMPVRNFFPFVGIHDTQTATYWLAELEGKASWQPNATRLTDRVALYGGLPDHDSGNWQVELKQGESYTSPYALLTVGTGTLEYCSKRLQKAASLPKAGLPITYNEFATTWGNPNQELIESSLPLLKKHGTDYYVIDAGWAKDATEELPQDWVVDEKKFPNGLKPVVDAIHAQGMKAGIWYEIETAAPPSAKYHDLSHLLTRDGVVISTIKRRFLNLFDPKVRAYIRQVMIDPVRAAGFDYLKIDYNDTIGVGVDVGKLHGPESLEQLTGKTLEMFSELHKIPGLEIENCASGGHRLTPAYIEATEYSSFSDAHDSHAIPIIAANELNVIPAAKNLIWCVLHADSTDDELNFHLISTFLGLACLSGDIRGLSDQQWQTVDTDFKFYKENQHLIAEGTPIREGQPIISYFNPVGYQVSGFVNHDTVADSDEMILMIFGFNLPEKQTISIAAADGAWHVEDVVGAESIEFAATETGLKMTMPKEVFTAKALRLTRH